MGQKHTALSGEVDLSGKTIGSFPNSIQPRDFQRLKSLDLSSNALTEIPAAVLAQLREQPRLCQTLTSLNLSRNKFTTLPEELSLLVSLTSLKLDGNPLTELPITLSALYKLEKLSVTSCKLKLLPPNLGSLKNLKDLRVNDNDLRYLPSDIGSIPSLKKLCAQTFSLLRLKFHHILISHCNDNFSIVYHHLLRLIQDNPLPSVILDYFFLSDTKNLQIMIAGQEMPKEYKSLQEKFTAAVEQMGGVVAADKGDPLKGERFEIFKSLLQDPVSLASFKKHLEKEHATENINFYEAVEAFKRKYASAAEITTSECVTDAEKIYDRFIHDNAPEPINLPVKSKKQVDVIYQDTYKYPAGVNQWIFNECHSCIVQLMFTDSLKRFMDSQEGKEVWAKREKAWRKANK